MGHQQVAANWAESGTPNYIGVVLNVKMDTGQGTIELTFYLNLQPLGGSSLIFQLPVTMK